MEDKKTKNPVSSTTKTTQTKQTKPKEAPKTNENANKIAELEAMVAKLSKMITEQNEKNIAQSAPVVVAEVARPLTQKTKVTSLNYGELSLYSPTRGFVRFTKFGETLTFSYEQLCDYVNNCRTAAEEGLFYIADQQMVDELDLTESYKKIINVDVINAILNGELDASKYEAVLSGITESQKESIGNIFADKIYNREFTDLNKIDALSKVLGTAIMRKVEEMKGVVSATAQ